MKRAIAVLAMAAAPALAETHTAPFPEKTFGAWRVYATSEDCWMKRKAPNGNEFMVSTANDDRSLYVVMRKKAWTFVKEDAELPMRIRFGGVDVTGRGSGSVGEGDLTPGMVMYLRDPKGDYLAELRRSHTIRTWLDGKPALDVNMSGAGPALDYFAQCTAVIRRNPG